MHFKGYMQKMEGAVDSNSNIDNGLILTLPRECRPPRRAVFNTRCGNQVSPCRVDILSNGYVVFVGTIGWKPWDDLSNGGYVSLDGIVFSTSVDQVLGEDCTPYRDERRNTRLEAFHNLIRAAWQMSQL